jgi:hypothetical protein
MQLLNCWWLRLKSLPPLAWAIVTITLGMSFAFITTFTFEIFQYGDNCNYMVLGMSLASGQGLSDIAQPHHPPLHWWPAGYPLLIAFFYSLAGARWELLKVLQFALLGLSLVVWTQTIYRRQGTLSLALLVGMSLSVSATLHLLSSYLFSETMLVVLSLTLVGLWYYWEPHLTLPRIVLLSLLALYCVMVRNGALTLMPALTIALALKVRHASHPAIRWSWLLPLALLTLYLLAITSTERFSVGSFDAFIGRKLSVSSSITKWSEPLPLTTRLLHSLRGYTLTLVPQALMSSWYGLWPMDKVKALAMFCISILTLMGWIVTLRRWIFVNSYVALSMGMLLIYGAYYVRLLVPLMPFLALYFIGGMRWSVHTLFKSPLKRQLLVGACGLALIFDNVSALIHAPHQSMPPRFGNASYQSALRWAQCEIKPGAVVVCQLHSYLFLRRGPYAVPFRETTTPATFMDYITRVGANYLVISPYYHESGTDYMKTVQEAIKANPQLFTRVFSAADGLSYILHYEPKPSQRAPLRQRPPHRTDSGQ